MKDIYTSKYNILVGDTLVVLREIRSGVIRKVAPNTYKDIMCDCYEGHCRPNEDKIDVYFRRKLK